MRLRRLALAAFLLVPAACGKQERVHKAAGNMYLRRGDSEAAVREFRAATQLAPRDPGAHTLLADALYERGDLDGASAEYEQALQLLPGATDAHRGLAAIATRRGHPGEAER